MEHIEEKLVFLYGQFCARKGFLWKSGLVHLVEKSHGGVSKKILRNVEDL